MWCYNKDTKTKEVNSMKYRVCFKDNRYFSTYFKTKKEAVAFQQENGGCIQRKIGCEWCDY